MPILLLRSDSSTPLSSLVESAQKKVYPLFQYELQLRDNCLELTLVGKLERKLHNYSTDEGFESDIDSLSLVSSDNDSFTTEKLVTPSSKTIETDSANGSSSSDSDTETSESKSKETPNELQDKKPKQSFNLVDCVCYTDVKCTDILIFVIKSETFVFKFEDVKHLEKFYTSFTTLKALTNQKLFNKTFENKFNFLQVTDRNGITQLEFPRETELKSLTSSGNGPNSLISIPTDETNRVVKAKDVNSRQRIVNNSINQINSAQATKKIPKSSSLENIIDIDDVKSELVNKESNIKIWNSMEDILDPPKRPERRKKNKAPPPPQKPQNENVLRGKFVRVKVNFDSINPLDKERLMIKSTMHEPHPKKLQHISMFSTKPNFTSVLKKDKHILRYEPKKLDLNNVGRVYARNDASSWTNSVPRLLKKPKTRNPTPMAYRYIDTAHDYPLTHNIDHNSNYIQKYTPAFGHNIAFSNYLRGETSSPNIGNRVFGLNPKLKDLQLLENKDNSWKPTTDYSKDNNLKSVIKGNKDEMKKKNDKKVTFSAYTTVQVV